MPKNPSRPKRRRAAERNVTAAVPPQLQDNTRSRAFRPENLGKSVIAIPLLQMLDQHRDDRERVYPVIIDLHLGYPDGLQAAKKWAIESADKTIRDVGINKDPGHQGIDVVKSGWTPEYLFARLEAGVIRELVRRDGAVRARSQSRRTRVESSPQAIYHIWPDFQIRPLTYKSISTIKVDAVHSSFSAFGQDIVWAVVDTGIDADHPHFKRYRNLELEPPLRHVDLSGSGHPTVDKFGHGTHVAGIIAGSLTGYAGAGGKDRSIWACEFARDENGVTQYVSHAIDAISGMAPRCKLLSIKVCDDKGIGGSSNVIAALGLIQEMNGYGRHLIIHGVNISLGYPFDVDWFACGQSPLCVAVDRLVRSGVVVVVAAGNSLFYNPAVKSPIGSTNTPNRFTGRIPMSPSSDKDRTMKTAAPVVAAKKKAAPKKVAAKKKVVAKKRATTKKTVKKVVRKAVPMQAEGPSPVLGVVDHTPIQAPTPPRSPAL